LDLDDGLRLGQALAQLLVLPLQGLQALRLRIAHLGLAPALTRPQGREVLQVRGVQPLTTQQGAHLAGLTALGLGKDVQLVLGRELPPRGLGRDFRIERPGHGGANPLDFFTSSTIGDLLPAPYSNLPGARCLTYIGTEGWHIDKQVCGRRLCESTGTGNLEEPEHVLAKRVEEIRQAVIFGVRPSRTVEVAATKFCGASTSARSRKTPAKSKAPRKGVVSA
jgi:hypothetical protein